MTGACAWKMWRVCIPSRKWLSEGSAQSGSKIHAEVVVGAICLQAK